MSSVILVAQEEAKAKANAEMAFETLSHDYGSIVYDADGTYQFKFTNKSKKPIVITNVKSSCGCTIPAWPKEPIQPGEVGNITVKYNTKLAGSFNKTVQVFSTAENSPVKLSIRGKVNAKPSDIKNTTSSTRLLNGTGVKEGFQTGNALEDEAETTLTTEAAIEADGSLTKKKQFQKKTYQKKVEAQKTIK